MNDKNPLKDTFFSSLANTKPYFKAALEGFAATGKTYTAAQIAVGLYKKITSKKPVIIFDTEKSSKFLKDMFAKAKIEVLVKESHSLADLKEVMRRMREGASDILIIDSISHIWENFLDAYKNKVHRTALQFQDWGIIKPSWKAEFSTPFVNDPYHILMCGRAGYEYESEKNEETGRREIYKSGLKMKVEGETAYEPDMLILMERFEEVMEKTKKVWREATILKDRSTLIDGKVFRNPTYKDFEPAIEKMMENPEVNEQEPEISAEGLFKTEDEKREFVKEKKKALEEIEGLLVHLAPGQSKEEKKFKVDILEKIFGTRSWTAITQLSPEKLKEGLENMKDDEEVKLMKADTENMKIIDEMKNDTE